MIVVRCYASARRLGQLNTQGLPDVQAGVDVSDLKFTRTASDRGVGGSSEDHTVEVLYPVTHTTRAAIVGSGEPSHHLRDLYVSFAPPPPVILPIFHDLIRPSYYEHSPRMGG